MSQVWCKKEGIGKEFGEGEGQAALVACKESDECTSVIHDACETKGNFKLCNGLQFERRGGTYKCNKAGRKKCECP